MLTFCCRCTLKFTSYKHESYNFTTTDLEHDLESAPKTLYRICDAVARQNGNALHLIVRGREDKSVGFIVLIVAEES